VYKLIYVSGPFVALPISRWMKRLLCYTTAVNSTKYV